MRVMNSNDPWRLRTADGTLYGPAKLDKMILWAEEGKILPGCHLSQDDQNWIPAENIAALDLRWYVSDGSGQLRGPLNKRAAQTLINAAPNPAGLRLVSAREVGNRKPDTPLLDGFDLPEADEQPPPQKTSRPANPSRPADTPANRPAEQSPEFFKLQDANADLAEQLAAKDAALREASQSAQNALEENNILSAQLDQLKNNNTELTQLLAQKDTALNDSAQRAIDQNAVFAASNAELRDAIKSLNTELAEKNTALSQYQTGNTHLANQLSETQSQHAAALAELTSTRAQLADAQASREQLLADFAELTDLANTRDNEHAQTIANLQRELDQARVRPPSALDELRPLLIEELDTLDAELDALKTLSAQRQSALQNRRNTLLQKLNAVPASANPDAYLKTGANTRLQADLQLLRDTHAAEMRKFEEREHSLLRKLRATESTLEGLRAQFANLDNRNQTNRDLSDAVSRLKQQLASLQKQRDNDLERFEADRSTLLERITQLEAPATPAAASRENPPTRFRFMTLKK